MKYTEKEIADSIKAQENILAQIAANDNKLHMIQGDRATPDEWEQPISFGNITVPSFPIDCLPSTLKDYVQAVSEATQTPVDMAAVASLAVMATCVQGKYKVQGKPDWIEPLNLYSVIVANPAERKSAVMALLTKYIDEYERKTNEKNAQEINQNRLERKILEKEIDRMTEEVAKGKGDKKLLLAKQDELTNFRNIKPLRLFADDASAEALTTLLATNNGKMAVISSEGGIFEILNGRYSQSVNIDTFLKAHCGDPIRIDRKGRESEYIKEPCLTVLLSIQPQVLDGLITNEVFRGRGLTARFLYSMPVSNVGGRRFETEAISTKKAKYYKDLCFDLLDIKQNGAAELITLSSGAYELSAAFAKELEPRLIDDLDGLADFAGKLHGTVLRIAGILHLTEQLVFAAGTPISAETMYNAIQLGYYFLEHAKLAYQLMGADEKLKDAKYVLSKLEKQSSQLLSKREIFRLCRGRYKLIEELLPSINILLECGFIKEHAIEAIAGGRPKDNRYILNPLYFNK